MRAAARGMAAVTGRSLRSHLRPEIFGTKMAHKHSIGKIAAINGDGQRGRSSLLVIGFRSHHKRIAHIPPDAVNGLALKTVISTRRLAWRASLPLPAPLPVSINFCCPKPTMW